MRRPLVYSLVNHCKLDNFKQDLIKCDLNTYEGIFLIHILIHDNKPLSFIHLVLDIVKNLDLNYPITQTSAPVLFDAIIMCRPDAVQLLLDYGADIYRSDDYFDISVLDVSLNNLLIEGKTKQRKQLLQLILPYFINKQISRTIYQNIPDYLNKRHPKLSIQYANKICAKIFNVEVRQHLLVRGLYFYIIPYDIVKIIIKYI